MPNKVDDLDPKEILKPSDLRKKAQELVESGQMPSLDQLLATVSFARQRYLPQIIAARRNAALIETAATKDKKGKEEEHGAPADFPGPVFPNPKGIKPQLDTERPKHATGPMLPKAPLGPAPIVPIPNSPDIFGGIPREQ